MSVTTAAGKPIPFTTEKADNSTRITINFNDKVVGTGKSQHFFVTYTNPDLTQYAGTILEINIPKNAQPERIDQFSATISVPIQFSSPSFISPKDYTITQDPALTVLKFNSDTPMQQGITAIFGDRQTYSVNLSYQLSNTSVTPIETQIALPPDTPYQRVFINSIKPPPQALKHDDDGNWIATYSIEPKTEHDISYQALIQTVLFQLNPAKTCK